MFSLIILVTFHTLFASFYLLFKYFHMLGGGEIKSGLIGDIPLISAQKYRLWYSLEPPRRAVLTSTHNLCLSRNMKNIRFFYLKIFSFGRWNFLYIWIHHENILYNFDPHKPHLYIVKLGFTRVCIIFLFLLINIDCGYSLEPPQWASVRRFYEYQQSMFWAEIWKYQFLYLKTFSFLVVKFSMYLNRRVFVMRLFL